MQEQRWLEFSGLDACVALQVDPDFLPFLGPVFSNWPHKVISDKPDSVFATVCLSGSGYRLSSPFMEAPETFLDPVNTLCRLVVELAWARLRERPDFLCLHGAAVEINGRLVVFPSTRRAGKSTLTVGFMAAGHRVFTDDFLPLEIDENNVVTGLSQGISPRLRLPLPDQIGLRARAYSDAQPHAANRQYRYVVPNSGDAAAFGTGAPLGALVFLERRPGKPPQIAMMEQSDVLASLIRQNFSRAMNAAAILNVLGEVACGVPAYQLSYDDVEPAIDVLQDTFARWTHPPIAVDSHDFSAASELMLEAESEQWMYAPLARMPDVSERVMDGKRFLSDGAGQGIVFLNQGAAAIWTLLTEPISLPEIFVVLKAAFPDQNPQSLERDATATVQSLVENRLIGVSVLVSNDQSKLGGFVESKPDGSLTSIGGYSNEG